MASREEEMKLRAARDPQLIRRLRIARTDALESPHLGFADPPALAIDRFIDVLLGGDGSNTEPFPPES